MKSYIQPPSPPSEIQAKAVSAEASATTGPVASRSFDVVTIKQYFHIIVKRIWLVALCFVISVAVTVVNLSKQVNVYRSGATLLLSRGLPLPERVRQLEQAVVGDAVETQSRILQSGTILSRARERMNRPREEIAGKLMRVSVYPIGKSAILYVGVDATEAQFAADFANAICDSYLDFKAEERLETSQSTVISLTQQANRIRDELKRAEERALEFKKENRIAALADRGNIAELTISKLMVQYAAYRTERMVLEAQQPMLAKASDDIVLATLASPAASLGLMMQGPFAFVSGDNASTGRMVVSQGPESLLDRGVVQQPGWEGLKRNQSLLEARLIDLRKTYRDEHPQVQAVLQSIQESQAAIDREVQFAMQEFYSNLESLKLKEQAVTRAQSEWEDEALETTRKADEYANLKRELERLRGLYDLVFSRLKEVDISTGIEMETVRIIERAAAPGGPITPRKMQSIFMAALLGMGIGIALVFGLEFIDDSIRYPEEVSRDLAIPFLGVIPSANWDPDDLRSHLLTNMDQKSGLSEAYRNVRSALLFTANTRSMRTLVIASAVPREGKTTTSLNLSVSLAQAGLRVLLVDADMRRGEIHKFFGLEGGRGLSDVLAGQAKPESVIQRTGLPNLDLVATGPFPVNPSELILRNEFHAFVEYARRTYDRIIFDGPPIMAVSESAILASLVDGVVMVVWAGQTSRKLAQLSLQTLRQRGAQVVGCILNNLEFGRVGYYYYSTYYGYYDYDYRYDRPAAKQSGV
jgi:succinoglycan biosynthesis transport protein ExoP